jgi:serine/threonine-protein kinase
MPTDRRQSSPPRALAAGDEVAGATLVEPIAQGERLSCWRAKREDGSPATVHVLTQAANPRERKNFLEGARRIQRLSRSRPITGVMEIVAIEPMELAYVGRGAAVGTMEDIKVLGWGTKEMVAFVRRLSRALGRLHAADVFHGCMRPANVLIDSELRPRLADIGMIVLDDTYDGPSDMKHDYSAYAAREIRLGEKPTPRSDVFSVGRLLYFALLGTEPDEEDEDLPLLRALNGQPPGLVRIIRRCTTREPDQRYPDMGALVADLANWEVAGDVGLKHPKGEEAAEAPEDEEAPPSSRRAGAPASSRPADSMRPRAPEPADGKEDKPAPVAITPIALREDEEEDVLTPTQSRLGGLLGVVVILGALAVAYQTASSSVFGVVAVFVGVIGLSLAMPVMGSAPVASRVLAAIVLGLGMFAADPVNELAEMGRRARLAEGSPAERVPQIQRFVERGHTNLGGIDYSGLVLTGMDLRGVSFNAARLTGTDFSKAKLAGASFDGADVSGANFAGADLSGAEMVKALGWQQARCDEDTAMPADWFCDEGQPTPEQVTLPNVRVEPE